MDPAGTQKGGRLPATTGVLGSTKSPATGGRQQKEQAATPSLPRSLGWAVRPAALVGVRLRPLHQIRARLRPLNQRTRQRARLCHEREAV